MQKDILKRLIQAQADKQPVVLVTFLVNGEQGLYFADGSVEGPTLTDDLLAMASTALHEDRCRLADDEQVFVQPFNPPLRMIIVGAVHISQSLANMAGICGYQVTVIDPRQSFAAESRFPGVKLVTDWPDAALESLQPDSRTAVVTLTHDPKLDDPALAIALNSGAFYIGALGSRKTQQARQDRLRDKGFTEEQQARIHGPVGLDIGACTPAEIAIAIMGQVTEMLHKRAA